MNLIGEHTDYNDGFVVPVSIPYRISVELRPRADRRIHATSSAFDGEQEYELGSERRTGTWLDHAQGVTHVLARDGLLERGFDARISSDLPMGAGLGSSGALAVALLRAVRDAFGIALDDIALARAAQRGERELVGSNPGIMDQMAAALARENEALFLDCRSLEFERIPLPTGIELLVVHSGVTNQHSAGKYTERRRQCDDAARSLGVTHLRDVGLTDLGRVEGLPAPLDRRARHVVMENARVLEAARALRSADMDRLGPLLDASHRSLRDDFEVSTPEVDLLVELVREQPGVRGARITGGGFGGSIVAVAEVGTAHHAGALAVAEYEQRTGLDARILLPGDRSGLLLGVPLLDQSGLLAFGTAADDLVGAHPRAARPTFGRVADPVRVAVIPAAGLGTRFLPVSKTIPKEMLPLVDVPIIDLVISEAVAAGCERIVVVSAPGKAALDGYFRPNEALVERLRAEGRDSDLALARRGETMADITVVHQDQPRGNGHAVLCARDAVGREPFVMIWGDDIVFARVPVAAQLVQARERLGGGSVAAVMRVPKDEVRRYGVIEGEPVAERTWRVRRIVEKPEHPPTELGAVHAYVLDPEIFDVLGSMAPGKGGEIWLSEAVSQLAQRAPVHAYEFEGERFDAGDRAGYVKAVIAAALERPEIADDVRAWIQRRVR